MTKYVKIENEFNKEFKITKTNIKEYDTIWFMENEFKLVMEDIKQNIANDFDLIVHKEDGILKNFHYTNRTLGYMVEWYTKTE